MRTRELQTLAIAIAVLALTVGGCAKKKAPATPEEMPVEVEQVSDFGDEPREPRPTGTRNSSDIWSADLDALNAYVREQGLLQTVYSTSIRLTCAATPGSGWPPTRAS